jgi:hypothetical protein
MLGRQPSAVRHSRFSRGVLSVSRDVVVRRQDTRQVTVVSREAAYRESAASSR